MGCYGESCVACSALGIRIGDCCIILEACFYITRAAAWVGDFFFTFPSYLPCFSPVMGRCLYRNNYSGVRSWIFLPRDERANICPMARPSAPVNHCMNLVGRTPWCPIQCFLLLRAGGGGHAQPHPARPSLLELSPSTPGSTEPRVCEQTPCLLTNPLSPP